MEFGQNRSCSYPHGLYDQPLILKLEKHDRLSEAEKRALENAIARIRVVEADEDLVREGDRPEKARSSWMALLPATRSSRTDGGRSRRFTLQAILSICTASS